MTLIKPTSAPMGHHQSFVLHLDLEDGSGAAEATTTTTATAATVAAKINGDVTGKPRKDIIMMYTASNDPCPGCCKEILIDSTTDASLRFSPTLSYALILTNYNS
mmetsp:Transcript_3728/g.8975  ORF Transcript_3728/g.8975 Transcript_3728/m.8975 type:complete len:105 (-) Transcript_3728:272-586(-)